MTDPRQQAAEAREHAREWGECPLCRSQCGQDNAEAAAEKIAALCARLERAEAAKHRAIEAMSLLGQEIESYKATLEILEDGPGATLLAKERDEWRERAERYEKALRWIQEFATKMSDRHTGFVHVERAARAALEEKP